MTARRPARPSVFATKAAARQHVWDRLQREGLARAPLPPHGRIPNFAGAARAARRLFEFAPWCNAQRLKINPDSPQAYVRLEALRRGILLYVPTPRLAGGFFELDPARIGAPNLAAAAQLATMPAWARPVPLDALAEVDAIVTGCAAVTCAGKRCGKGMGYSDLEYAILRELGHRPVPVATTVHGVQLVGDFPVEPHDLPLSLIVTPTREIQVAAPLPAPARIAWETLSAEALAAMPILRALRAQVGGSVSHAQR